MFLRSLTLVHLHLGRGMLILQSHPISKGPFLSLRFPTESLKPPLICVALTLKARQAPEEPKRMADGFHVCLYPGSVLCRAREEAAGKWDRNQDQRPAKTHSADRGLSHRSLLTGE